MAVVPISTVGTCVSFAFARPTTEVQADFEALTWVKWDEITQIGDLGGTDSLTEVTPTCDGIVRKVNGPRNNGSQSMEAIYDSTKAAHVGVRAAYEARTPISAKLELPNGDILYYPVRILAAPITPGSASDVVMIKPQVEVDGAIIDVLAA